MRENPTNDRLRYIAKQYGDKKPMIVVNMVQIIAATVGADHWFHVLIDVADKANDMEFHADLLKWGRLTFPRMSGEPLQLPSRKFIDALVELVSGMPQFVLRNRADPLFPWMAQQLAKLYYIEPLHHGGVLAHQDRMNAYSGAVNALKLGGTALAQWYERVRPNLGGYDLDRAFEEADEWNATEGPIPQGEVVTNLSDGWTAQKLTTKEQMDVEGTRMQHCVGTRGYFDSSQAGRLTIYSLRDEKGHPHVTLEVSAGRNPRVEQTKGKQNASPDKKYEKYVDEFYEWLETKGVGTTRVPEHLRDYVRGLNEHAHDAEEEYIVDYARQWDEHTANAAEMIEWLKAGLSESEAELAGALHWQDVTPEMWVKFPTVVYRKITSEGGVPRDLDDLVKIALMAMTLGELAPKRDPNPESKQTDLFERGPKKKVRVHGHEPMPHIVKRHTYKQHGTDLETSYTSNHIPSLVHGKWEEGSSEEHLRVKVGDEWVVDKTQWDLDEWVYSGEEWIVDGFTHDPEGGELRRGRKKTEGLPNRGYVGPWFLAWFTPEEAAEWFDFGIEDGEVAAELRNRRVTLKMLEDNEVAVEKKTAQQIVESIDDRGIARNPGRKRSTSKRRTSRRVR